MEGQFFDFAITGTLAGCVAITVALTAFVKQFMRPDAEGKYKFPIPLISFIIAVALMVGASVSFGTFGWESVILSLINGALVSLSANGGYDNGKRLSK
jgi:hypothetical protein